MSFCAGDCDFVGTETARATEFLRGSFSLIRSIMRAKGITIIQVIIIAALVGTTIRVITIAALEGTIVATLAAIMVAAPVEVGDITVAVSVEVEDITKQDHQHQWNLSWLYCLSLCVYAQEGQK